MNVHYKRDLNSNYMILTDEHREDGYEVQLITENRIYGFLPCVCQEHEQRTEYYYEITGRQMTPELDPLVEMRSSVHSNYANMGCDAGRR